jgi:hypothetical protein
MSEAVVGVAQRGCSRARSSGRGSTEEGTQARSSGRGSMEGVINSRRG